MTFSEAAMIMMSGGGKVIQPIAITQYGDYEIKAPEGVDGYNPIHVNLKDRYQAGYTDGWMKCFLNIKTITITKNGTYNAKSENLEGYNPVVVNVPDRYDEGFQAGYTEGDNDGREAQKKICDEEKAILIEEIDRQDKKIETLETYINTKYPDESDTINAIKGVEFIADVPDAKYSYSYRIASPGKLTNGGLYNSDKYRMYVYVTRSDGEKYTVSTTLPETTTRTDTDPPLYGYKQLGQCTYFTTDGTNAILHYRYCLSGPWTSYDEWRTVYYPLN